MPSPFLRDEEQEKIFSMLEADLEKNQEKKPAQEIERVKKALQEALESASREPAAKEEAKPEAAEPERKVVSEAKQEPKSLDEKIEMLKKELGIL